MKRAILSYLRQQLGDSSPLPQPIPPSRIVYPHIVPHIPGSFSDSITPHIPGLYRSWISDLLSGIDLLPVRSGRLWVHRRVRLGLRFDISASAVDSLLNDFKLKACEEGYLLGNPSYTGRAPFPRYLLSGGAL